MQRNAAEEAALSAAKQELSLLYGTAGIDILSIETAFWSDASMGWPEEGKSYVQILMEGYRIIAKIAGKSYECRVSGDVVRCKSR